MRERADYEREMAADATIEKDSCEVWSSKDGGLGFDKPPLKTNTSKLVC